MSIAAVSRLIREAYFSNDKATQYELLAIGDSYSRLEQVTLEKSAQTRHESMHRAIVLNFRLMAYCIKQFHRRNLYSTVMTSHY